MPQIDLQGRYLPVLIWCLHSENM